jgi:hypothetical protein
MILILWRHLLLLPQNMHHNITLEKMWVHNAQIIVSTHVYTQNVASWLAEAIMGLKMAFIGRGTMSHFNVIVPCRWLFSSPRSNSKNQRVIFTQFEENSLYCTIGKSMLHYWTLGYLTQLMGKAFMTMLQVVVSLLGVCFILAITILGGGHFEKWNAY